MERRWRAPARHWAGRPD